MFTIIGKRFTPDEFAAYVAMLDFEPGGFKPDMVVLHNTAVPPLATRPDGFTEAHMRNLRGYYAGMGWKGGPHLFVDHHGIWVFNPLDRRGTHSPSWNSHAWGVEMLGDYDKEPFGSGRGVKVRDNTAAAVAVLLTKIWMPSILALKLHKEDPKTDHDCPGKNVDKGDFWSQVSEILDRDGNVAPKAKPCKIVFYRKGQGHDPAGVLDGEIRPDGKAYFSAKAMSITTGIRNDSEGMVRASDFLHGAYRLNYDAAERKVYAVAL